MSPSRLRSAPSLPRLGEVPLKSTRHRLFQKNTAFIVLDANIVFELRCSAGHAGGARPDRGAQAAPPAEPPPRRFSDREAQSPIGALT